MIALGGVIGAALFVGSGAVINQTGPAAVLAEAVAAASAPAQATNPVLVSFSDPRTGRLPLENSTTRAAAAGADLTAPRR